MKKLLPSEGSFWKGDDEGFKPAPLLIAGKKMCLSVLKWYLGNVLQHPLLRKSEKKKYFIY